MLSFKCAGSLPISSIVKKIVSMATRTLYSSRTTRKVANVIQFILPLEGGKLPMTLNTQRNMHFRQVSKVKKQTEIDVSNACATKGIPYIGVIDEILFTLVVRDKRLRDADNIAPLGKATMDALKTTGIIDEDHYKIVKRVSYNIHYDPKIAENYALITIWGKSDEDDLVPLPEISVTPDEIPGQGDVPGVSASTRVPPIPTPDKQMTRTKKASVTKQSRTNASPKTTGRSKAKRTGKILVMDD